MTKPNSLKQASLKQLEREIDNRKATRIAELKEEMTSIENEIRELGGKTKNTSVKPVIKSSKNKTIGRIKKSMAKTRATNEKSLKDLLVDISSDGKARTMAEFVSEAQSKGWKTSSPKPYYIVAAALAAQEKKQVFRRVSKGTYELIKNEQ